MAKKNKGLSQFGDVAKRQQEDVEVMEEAVDTYSVNFVEVLDDMIQQKAAKKKVQRSFYLDSEVVKALDKVSKNKPKGFKSDLVNSFLRKTFGLDAETIEQKKDRP